MDAILHTFKETYVMTVKIEHNGNCRIRSENELHKRDVINKMACFNPTSDYSFPSELYEETDIQAVPPGAKLFVSSTCKTQRDIFRNSGYTIKLKPDDADVIVVPDIVPESYYNRTCNLVGMDANEENLFLITIEKPGYYSGNEITVDDIENVKRFLVNLRNYKFDDSELIDKDVWFIPKCEELKEVILNQKRFSLVPYIQESLVPINASTKFSPETLMYWRSIAKQDQELLARTICTSDWRDYPNTLLAFLKTNGDTAWNLVGNADFKNILRVIGYINWYNLEDNLNEHDFKPKDYEMLQSYLYYLFGIDQEKGGVVDWRTIDSNNAWALMKFLQRRYVFKPLKLTSKTKAIDIKELAK